MRTIDPLTAFAAQERLRKKDCCSQSWVERVVKPADETGRTWTLQDEAYPPGGDKTLMRECPACRRVAPPDTMSNLCPDCVEEKFAERLEERAAKSPLPGMRDRLWKLATQRRRHVLLRGPWSPNPPGSTSWAPGLIPEDGKRLEREIKYANKHGHPMPSTTDLNWRWHGRRKRGAIAPSA